MLMFSNSTSLIPEVEEINNETESDPESPESVAFAKEVADN